MREEWKRNCSFLLCRKKTFLHQIFQKEVRQTCQYKEIIYITKHKETEKKSECKSQINIDTLTAFSTFCRFHMHLLLSSGASEEIVVRQQCYSVFFFLCLNWEPTESGGKKITSLVLKTPWSNQWSVVQVAPWLGDRDNSVSGGLKMLQCDSTDTHPCSWQKNGTQCLQGWCSANQCLVRTRDTGSFNTFFVAVTSLERTLSSDRFFFCCCCCFCIQAKQKEVVGKLTGKLSE